MHPRFDRTLALILGFGVALLSGNPAGAEDAAADGPLAGHSYHGEAFNEGPRQFAYLMGGTGDVHFPVTVSDPKGQAFFDQGVGQLHGFWYYEAERSFRQVLNIDPDCAMAYWGMSVANENNAKRAKEFIAKAVELKTSASDREKLWIDALAKYREAKEKDVKKRKAQYIRDIENIIHENPDDVEAKAFLAVLIWQFRSDLPISSHQAVDALLDQVFEANPMHPAHHYRIHLWDNEKPVRALASAALGGQSAPTIAHMWHMPGHTYSRVHRYADAVWQQGASSRADHAHMIRDRVMPDQIHNYAHNQEWMIRNLNHLGQSRGAIALAKNLVELPRHPNYNTLSKRGSAQYGRMRLFETLERFELWQDLIDLTETVYLEPTDDAKEQAKRFRARGLAYAGLNDETSLGEQVVALEELRADQETKKTEAAAKAEEKTREKQESETSDESDKSKASDEKSEKKAEEEIKKAREAAEKPFNTTIEEIDKALNELKGHEKLLAGEPKLALELFLKVKGLDKTTLARARWHADELDKAEEEARKAAQAAKNQVVPQAHYVEILHLLGKDEQAKKEFEKLRSMSAHIDDLSSPVFARLESIAEAFGFPKDWRTEPVARDDVGIRPPLDEIGPMYWHPSQAPSWSLQDSDGKAVSLNDYRGKPVIVIFYLGYGCLHCVEQLQAFAPKTKDFEDAGISLVAVSTDSVADLKKTVDQSGVEDFPIPLLSDDALDVFKAYRAYDDFESQPLHGTFLIDGSGLVRWQDISYEPFMKPDFVLEEAKRLLDLKPATVTAAK